MVGGVVQQTGFFGGLVGSRIERHGGRSFSRLGGEYLMSMSSLPVDVNPQALLLKQLSFGSVNLAAQGVHGNKPRSHVAGCLRILSAVFSGARSLHLQQPILPYQTGFAEDSTHGRSACTSRPRGIWQRAASLHRCDGVPKGLIGRSHLRITSAEITMRAVAPDRDAGASYCTPNGLITCPLRLIRSEERPVLTMLVQLL